MDLRLSTTSSLLRPAGLALAAGTLALLAACTTPTAPGGPGTQATPAPAPVSRFYFLGLCFVIGLTTSALIARHAVLAAKRLDEFVTVKGLSEREVPADLGIWPVTFTLLDNDLSKLLEQIQKSRGIVQTFLVAQGFEAGEISNAPPQIDLEAFHDKRNARLADAWKGAA